MYEIRCIVNFEELFVFSDGIEKWTYMHELLNGVRVYMLIPTIAVFFGIKKPLLKRETRKLLEKKLGSTPITNDVLTSVYWALSNQEYISNDAFTKDIIDYIPDNKDNWNPYGIAVNTRKVCIVYEAFITGAEQLRSNEHIVDINDLENLHANEWRFFYGDI